MKLELKTAREYFDLIAVMGGGVGAAGMGIVWSVIRGDPWGVALGVGVFAFGASVLVRERYRFTDTPHE